MNARRALREMAARKQAGLHGERAVEQALEPLTRLGWRLLSDRAIPRSPANIDHLLVGPPGIVVVDSKAHSGPVRLAPSGDLLVRGRPFRRERDAVLGYAAGAQQAAWRSGWRAPALPMLCFSQDVGLSAPLVAGPLVALQLDQLVYYLQSLPAIFTPQQVWQLSECLDSAYPSKNVRIPPRQTYLSPPAIPAPPAAVRRGRHQAGQRTARPRPDAAQQALMGIVRIAMLVVLGVIALTVVSNAVKHIPTGTTPHPQPSVTRSAGP